jgi:polyisoprenyl-phosphate glycosyltransferase
MKTLSAIVTCYNEEGNIQEMYSRLKKAFSRVSHYKWEIVYVDNASTDGSVSLYKKLASRDKRVKVIIMSRNFGSPQPSFIAGMEYAKGDAMIFLHGDIQDPPELIPDFVKKWEEGYDVAYGVRTKRDGYNIIWNILYKGFYWLLKKLAYISIPLDAGEFSLISKRVAQGLLTIDEYDYYLRCLRAYVGFKQIGIPYIREARHSGKSSENILSSIWWAKTIIINFSFKPLEWISKIGFLVTLCSFMFMFIDILLVLVFHNAPRGIPTVVIVTLFLGGIQLLSLAVIAEYLAKIFLEVKHRPRYIVETTLNL